MARGSVTYVKPGVWRIRWDAPADPATGARRQPSATVKGTKADAERELARRLATAEQDAVPPARLTVGQQLDAWLASRESRLAPSSVYTYAYAIRHLKAGLGAAPLAKLTGQQIEAHYLAEEKAGVAAASIGMQHSLLRQMLRQARRFKLVPYPVTEDVDPPRVVRPEPPILDAAGLLRLLQGAQGTPLRGPLVVFIVTGLRIGEVLGLWWSDLDWERGTLTVRRTLRRGKSGIEYGPPKSQAGRRVLSLGPLALAELKVHRERQAAGGELVFPWGDGGIWHPSTFSSSYHRLLRELDLPRLSPHKLRHSSISLSAALGIPAKVIQKRAGHARASQTDYYTHLVGGEEAAAALLLEEALREGFGASG